MSALSRMDRASRAQWQAAAARKRQWYQLPTGPNFKRSSSVVADVKFAHKWLVYRARTGVPWDPFWWS